MRTKLRVIGMTCDGCVNAVRRVLSRVPGVTDVQVDLAAGRAEVAGAADTAQLLAAVRKAGYEAQVAA